MTAPGNVYLTFEQVQALLAAARGPVAEAAPAVAPAPAAPSKAFESMSSGELAAEAGAYYRRTLETTTRRPTFRA